MSNITLDDTAAQLSYSSGGWGTQSDSDPARSFFFGQTFHAAQTDGARVNMTFQGVSDVYIYGSKGPSHVRRLLLSNAQ